MKRWVKAYVIYLAGALAVLAYVLWSSRRHGIDLATLISTNGHTPAAADRVDELV